MFQNMENILLAFNQTCKNEKLLPTCTQYEIDAKVLFFLRVFRFCAMRELPDVV